LEPLYAVLLGIIQGLTEFLPVSSSGHLVLFQHLFGFQEQELFFDICLHVGTLVAILFVFYREIAALITTLFRLPALIKAAGGPKALVRENPEVRMILLIVVGTIPTGILGVLFHGIADQLFASPRLVGVMLMVTGCLLWLTRTKRAAGRTLDRVGLKDALLIGLVQGLAIIPGVSRSGSTIAISVLIGVDRELAGRFSFLLVIPAILGALVMSLEPGIIEKSSVSAGSVLAGTAFAAVVGYFSLKILLHMVKTARLSVFSPYCWAIGGLALIISFF